jgi:hypothetical protein
MTVARVLLCWMFTVAIVPLPWAQLCSHARDTVYYSEQQYTVRSVRVTSPFDFVSVIRRNEREATEQLSLRKGTVFQNSSYSAGMNTIKPFFGFSGIPSPLKLRVILPKVQNCDESGSRQLDVVYRVFLSNPLDYVRHPAEFSQSQIAQPASTTAAANADGRFVPALMIAYNRTTDLSAGGSLKFLLPNSWGTLKANALESGEAHFEKADWSTSKQFMASSINALNLRVSYQHSDQPTDGDRLKFAHLLAEAYASSKEFSSTHIALRYGGALEGGYEQSLGIETTVLPKVVPSQSYGGLKAYSGLTLSLENATISGSYALQAATSTDFYGITFLKHIGYVSVMSQIPLRQLERPGAVHHTLSIEWEVAGGFLQRMRAMPVSQRFFGGDAWQQFTGSDDWKIPGGPFIRSIPQNRLNASSVFGAPVGGSSFWSSAFTFSAPIWGHPLIPKDLAKDPTLEPAIAAEKAAAKNALILTYEKDLPAFKALVVRLPELDAELSQLKSVMDSIEPRAVSQAEVSFKACKHAIDSAARTSKDVQTTTPQSARALIVGSVSRMSKLAESLDDLSNSLRSANDKDDADLLQSHRNNVLSLQTSLAADLQKIDLTIPEKRADDDLRVVDPVLNSILHKLNVVSVAPVAVFDTGRLWPDAGRTRLGPGAGARFTIVTFNVTLGYAWNVHGERTEGPGAMFFSLDVSDIFH